MPCVTYTSEFPPFFVTCDLVVLSVRAGALHVLLVRRGGEPFAGRFALPGGFVEVDENLGVHFVVSQVQSLDQLLDDLKAAGAILGGQAFWERDLNSNQLMRFGGLRISYNYEPAPPVEDLGFIGYREEAYFDVLAEDIISALRSYGLTNR